MTTITGAVHGDEGDHRILALGGIDTLAAAATLETHVWRGDDRHTLTTTVEDAEACTVRVELGDNTGWLATETSNTSAQAWNVEVQVTFNDGTVLTFPQASPPTLPVRPAGDP